MIFALKSSFLLNDTWWLIPVCLVAGLIYAAALYYHDKRLVEMKRWIKNCLFVFRALTVATVVLLILNPLIETFKRYSEKPIVVVAVDNSQSIALAQSKPSGVYTSLMDQLKANNPNYEVNTYTFGSQVTENQLPVFNEKHTDFSELFNQLNDRYAGRNLSAVILVSDGIYTKGSNPVFQNLTNKAAIYTLGVGDTVPKNDAVLQDVEHNDLVFLGNDFSVNVIIKASGLKGKAATLNVYKNKKLIQAKKILYNQNSALIETPFEFEATTKGTQEYTVQLVTVAGEYTGLNNVSRFYIDVIDGREKVAILSSSPHPDVAAIKSALESSPAYKVDVFQEDQFRGSIADYDLLILNQVPSVKTAPDLLDDIVLSQKPIWSIVGAQSNFNALKRLNTGVAMVSTNQKQIEVEPVVNNNFPLFTLSEELNTKVLDFPALSLPFGNYRSDALGSALLNQQIGTIQSDAPMFYFREYNGKKIATILGEGIWRWKLRNYALANNHLAFNELITKTAQYLSVKADKSFFRVKSKSVFEEGEPVVIEAELYNKSYELVNEPEVTLSLTDSAQKKYAYVFSKYNQAYKLSINQLQPGTYSYTASVKVNNEVLQKNGSLVVRAITTEALNTTADHQLLRNLSSNTQGSFYKVNNIAKLVSDLKQNKNMAEVMYANKQVDDLIKLDKLFYLLLTLLTAEWLVRKRFGTV